MLELLPQFAPATHQRFPQQPNYHSLQMDLHVQQQPQVFYQYCLAMLIKALSLPNHCLLVIYNAGVYNFRAFLVSELN